MNSISASNGNSYQPIIQPQMNVASTPTQRGLQENQVAFTEDEARVLQQMIRAGVVSAAVVGATKRNELGVSALGLAGALQQGWQDQSILEKTLGEKITPFNNKLNVNHYNQRYLGDKGVQLWQRTASKNGMTLLDAQGNPLNPNVRNLDLNTVKLDMHTVNAEGEVLQYGARNNNFFQRAKNVPPSLLGVDTGGPFDDSLAMRGSSNVVAARAKDYANALRKLKDSKLPGAASNDAIAFLEARKTAKWLEFDQVRLQEACKSLLNHEAVLKLEKEALEKLKTGNNQTKIPAQEARVAQIQKVANAQRQHVIKLNAENARFVANQLSQSQHMNSRNYGGLFNTHQVAQNTDDIAKALMKDPNILQRAANLFNGDRAQSMQLYNQLQSYGFSKEQLKTIQKATQEAISSNNPQILKEALKTAAEQSETTAKAIADAARNGLDGLDDSAKSALNATVDSKGAMGALRNNLGVMGKVTKGLAIVGTALEALNFGVNMKNGDHRKGFSDLTTNVGSGLLAAGLVGLFGLPFLPAIAAGMVAGVVINKVAAPWVDKGFKALGFTNQNERDAQKAKVELQQFNQTLASAPTAMATA